MLVEGLLHLRWITCWPSAMLQRFLCAQTCSRPSRWAHRTPGCRVTPGGKSNKSFAKEICTRICAIIEYKIPSHWIWISKLCTDFYTYRPCSGRLTPLCKKTADEPHRAIKFEKYAKVGEIIILQAVRFLKTASQSDLTELSDSLTLDTTKSTK